MQQKKKTISERMIKAKVYTNKVGVKNEDFKIWCSKNEKKKRLIYLYDFKKYQFCHKHFNCYKHAIYLPKISYLIFQ